jgi:hypothetical protein
MPLASSLNYQAGQTIPNAVVAKIGDAGKVCLYTLAAAHLVVDVNGWMPLAANQPDSNVDVIPDGQATIIAGGPNTGRAAIQTNEPLSVNQIVVMSTTDGPYYGRVTAIDGTTVSTDEVALADVIPVMDLSFTADTKAGTVSVTDGGAAISGFTIQGIPAISPTSVAPEGNPPVMNSMASTTTFTCSADTNASITSALDANPGNFVFDVHLNKWKTGLGSARIGYNPYVTASLTAQALASVTCDQTFNFPTINLPTIKFSIYGVPVWITENLDSALHFHESATAAISRTITATASAWAGVTYQNGRWNREASINLTGSDTTAGDIGADVTADIPITYTALLYGLAGLHATLDPISTLQYRPLENKYLLLTGQVDLTIGAEVTLDLHIISFNKSTDFAHATLWGPKELWSKSTNAPTPTTTTTTSTGPTTTTTSTTLPVPEAVRVMRTEGPQNFETAVYAACPSPPDANNQWMYLGLKETASSGGSENSYVAVTTYDTLQWMYGFPIIGDVNTDTQVEPECAWLPRTNLTTTPTVVKTFLPFTAHISNAQPVLILSTAVATSGSTVTVSDGGGCTAYPGHSQIAEFRWSQYSWWFPDAPIRSVNVDVAGRWSPQDLTVPTTAGTQYLQVRCVADDGTAVPYAPSPVQVTS